MAALQFDFPEACRGFGAEGLDDRRRLAKDLVKVFARDIAPPEDSDEGWTTAVRDRLVQLCPSDCYPLPKAADSRRGEYLVDYTWAEAESGKRVLLAGESEWGTERFGKINWTRVEYDFEKLLAVKAPLKLLIFSSCCKSENLGSDSHINFTNSYARSKLEASLRGYGDHLAGEVYTFIDLPQTGDVSGPGRYESFIWVAKCSGRHSEVEFEGGPAGDLSRPTRPNPAQAIQRY